MNRIFPITSLLILVLWGCSTDPVDQFLDEYENVVETWESKADNSAISVSDINELNQASLKFSEKADELKKANEFSSSQLKRYMELSSRLGNAFLKMSKNKPSFGY